MECRFEAGDGSAGVVREIVALGRSHGIMVSDGASGVCCKACKREPRCRRGGV